MKTKLPVNPAEIQLENIYRILEWMTICKDKAAKIVGGTKKLEDLIAAGKIRVEKKSKAPNGKWYCNMADVFRHCRNARAIEHLLKIA